MKQIPLKTTPKNREKPKEPKKKKKNSADKYVKLVPGGGDTFFDT